MGFISCFSNFVRHYDFLARWAINSILLLDENLELLHPHEKPIPKAYHCDYWLGITPAFFFGIDILLAPTHFLYIIPFTLIQLYYKTSSNRRNLMIIFPYHFSPFFRIEGKIHLK